MSSRISTLHLKPWAIVLGCLADFGVTLVGGIVITLIAFVNVGDPTDVGRAWKAPSSQPVFRPPDSCWAC